MARAGHLGCTAHARADGNGWLDGGYLGLRHIGLAGRQDDGGCRTLRHGANTCGLRRSMLVPRLEKPVRTMTKVLIGLL